MNNAYRLTESSDVVICLDGEVAIPRGHRWWSDYEAWLAEGNQPLPAPDPIESVPDRVTRYQARAELYQAGLLDDVEALLAAPDTDRLLIIAWQDAQVFRRDSPMVLALGARLGLSAQQLDNLFIAAAAIE